jgi:hypothetical protein
MDAVAFRIGKVLDVELEVDRAHYPVAEHLVDRTPRRFTYLTAWHLLELRWHVCDPAGAVVGAGTGAPLGGVDEAEDSCCELFEFNDGSAGTCVPARLCGLATRLEDGRGERPACAAVLGETAPVVALGAGRSGVLAGCCTRVSVALYALGVPRAYGELSRAVVRTLSRVWAGWPVNSWTVSVTWAA